MIDDDSIDDDPKDNQSIGDGKDAPEDELVIDQTLDDDLGQSPLGLSFLDEELGDPLDGSNARPDDFGAFASLPDDLVEPPQLPAPDDFSTIVPTKSIDAERLKALPTSPGVYLMKDETGKVIYVGKAKNLRNRVKNYFLKQDGRYTVQFLVRRVADIETLITDDERQALILENNLIKQHQPRYNIKLKDDKSYFLVRVDMNHPWPRIELVRRREDDGARYIGPFAFSYELRALLDVVKESFPLRTCTDRVIFNRVRPCLEYQMKRCVGPCCLPVDREQYRTWVTQALAVLEGKNKSVVKDLEVQMGKASEDLRFEDAAMIRDRIEVLNRAVAEKPVLNYGEASRDAIGVFRDGPLAEITVLRIRNSRLFDTKTYDFDDVEIPTDELLSSFLSQFYLGGEEIPECVILPVRLEGQDALEELLQERRGKSVSLERSSGGSGLRIHRMAQENAKENFQARRGGALEGDAASRELAQALGLEQVPRTIECMDISHFQGGQTVGAVVHFKDGRPDKSRYRKFLLESLEGKPDDFASMREVTGRHLSRGMEENTLPDLLIIDGGPAQLNEALSQRKTLGLALPTMIGLAKKRSIKVHYRVYQGAKDSRGPYKPERVYLEDENRVPVVLREGTKALGLLERIRDEAHRFVITFHRAKRTQKTFQSVLDKIPGVGPNRRKALLRAFGSVRQLRTATPEDVVERTGLPFALAKRVLEFLAKEALKADPRIGEESEAAVEEDLDAVELVPPVGDPEGE